MRKNAFKKYSNDLKIRKKSEEVLSLTKRSGGRSKSSKKKSLKIKQHQGKSKLKLSKKLMNEDYFCESKKLKHTESEKRIKTSRSPVKKTKSK